MSMLEDNNNNIFVELNTTRELTRDRINKLLTSFGLEPCDYVITSAIEDQPDQESIKPIRHIQHPPPPPPAIKRPNSNQQEIIDKMATSASAGRRTPPSPPLSTDVQVYDREYANEQLLNQINSVDNPPVRVVKPNKDNVVYRKEIRIRYLQPPTPPPPAPIIIREKQIPPNPPESPLLIRERKPEPTTPPPLTIRERPPTPPAPLQPMVIEKPLPPPPPQPRQIIIERLPTPPPKPRTVIFEKWLPYKKVHRPILLEKAPPLPPAKPTRNVIIEYEPLKAYTVRRVIEEGIFRVDPNQYTHYAQQSDANVRIVDRIDDLPPPSEDVLRAIKTYSQHASSNLDELTNVTRLSNTPQRQERILSSAHSPASAQSVKSNNSSHI